MYCSRVFLVEWGILWRTQLPTSGKNLKNFKLNQVTQRSCCVLWIFDCDITQQLCARHWQNRLRPCTSAGVQNPPRAISCKYAEESFTMKQLNSWKNDLTLEGRISKLHQQAVLLRDEQLIIPWSCEALKEQREHLANIMRKDGSFGLLKWASSLPH